MPASEPCRAGRSAASIAADIDDPAVCAAIVNLPMFAQIFVGDGQKMLIRVERPA
jgi:hypothetical protein